MMPCNPVNYKIHLEPDLVKFTFAGTAEILFEAPQSIAEIVLNLLEIEYQVKNRLPGADQ